MLIGIISDTHDQLDRTIRAVDLLVRQGIEAIIHCGDFTQPDIIHACGVVPGYFVFGNNDFDTPSLHAAINAVGGICLDRGGEIVLAGRRIAVTHGDVTREYQRLLQARPDYLLLGHSHVPQDDRDDRTRLINPGALHRARSWTVATLDLTRDDLEFLRVE